MTSGGFAPRRPTVSHAPALEIVRRSWGLILDFPRETLLPFAVVQVPVAVISAALTATLFLTVFEDEPTDATSGGPLFATITIGAAEFLFLQVALVGSIVSIAGVATGRRRSLSESLDPAFSRMGQVIVLILLLGSLLIGVGSLLALTVIGLVFLPYLALRCTLAFQAFILDGDNPIQALVASWRMMKGHMLRIARVTILVFAIVVAPVVGLTLLSSASVDDRTADILLHAATTLIQGILSIPLVAFTTTVTTLFFLDLKSPKETEVVQPAA